MPTSALGVLVFVLAVFPGFYYELIRGRRFTRAKESAFYEASRTVAASVLLGLPAATVAFLGWLIVLNPSSPPDISALIKRDPGYLGMHARELAISLGIYIGSGFLLAHASIIGLRLYGLAKARFSALTQGVTSSHSLWTHVFKHRAPKGHVSIAQVRMKSGQIWAGPVLNFTTEHELTDRELVLHTPIRHGDQDNPSNLVATSQRAVILRGPEIESISILAYVLDDKPKKTKPRKQDARIAPAEPESEASDHPGNL